MAAASRAAAAVAVAAPVFMQVAVPTASRLRPQIACLLFNYAIALEEQGRLEDAMKA